MALNRPRDADTEADSQTSKRSKTGTEDQRATGPLAHREVIRIGIIGAGDISSLHVSGIRKSKHAILVGLWNRPGCSIVPDPAAKAREYGCKLFATAEELCQSGEIDAVYVLTNMETHFKYVKMAMEHGKHVMVEKPVGCNIKELREMIEIAKRHQVQCVPGHNYIHEPQIDRIKDLIESGQLGKVTQVYVTYNIHHPEEICARLPGIIRQILTHHGYITLYLTESLGDPSKVSAMKATINDGRVVQENLAHVTLQFASGQIGHLQASFANDDHTSAPWSFMIKVLGTKGGAHYNYNDFVVNAKHIVHSHTYCAYPYAVEAESEYFCNSILRLGAKPKSTMENAIMCQKIIEAAELSSATERHIDLQSIQ